jgi:hypothetical protein
MRLVCLNCSATRLGMALTAVDQNFSVPFMRRLHGLIADSILVAGHRQTLLAVRIVFHPRALVR